MQTVDPLGARRWFGWKGPMNWAISIAVFIPVFFLLMQSLNGLLAFAIALVPVFLLFFYYLDTRAIGIKCPHCGQYIETNTPWICGNKDTPHRNDRVDEFPFINHCQYCGFTPKAYQCHHCFKLIFLSEDKQVTAYARCADIPAESPKTKPVKKDKHAQALSGKIKDIELKKLDVEETKLAVELKGLKQTLEGPKMKSIEDQYRAALKNEDDERQLRVKIDKEFKDDDEERKRRHLTVDKIMRETI